MDSNLTELLISGVELMLAGMGIVFVFLTMLVLVIQFMSGLVVRYFPEPQKPAQIKPGSVSESAVVAAISSAVHHYRNTHKSR